MKREHIAWVIVVGVILFIGVLLGNAFDESPKNEATAFRTGFWEHRSIDLLTQTGIILAGALGVAAVLPEQREEENDADSEDM